MNAPPPVDGTAGHGASRKGLSSVPPRMWVALALLVVTVLFVAQNRDTAQIQFLVVSLTSPLWAALAVAVAAGVVIGLLVRPSRRRRRGA
ncbi:lipopolysaccharide assembly protein LapA domain-containing protein [Nocardiopsis sp. NPDC101807]|uniref:lipopolysaccharide assembly protein LapA domain-containing protein n=1 Tax=Nocardiopsis sp. NPDC101807 TaxID=3364339 RepID=UPI0038278F60